MMKRNRIQIRKKNDQLQLKILTEIKEHVWKTSINTTDKQIIQEVIQEIESQIQSAKLQRDILTLILKDQSEVLISSYSTLKEHFLLEPIRKNLHKKKINKKRKKNLVRAALLTFGILIGVNILPKKIINREAVAQEAETEIEMDFETLLNNETFRSVAYNQSNENTQESNLCLEMTETDEEVKEEETIEENVEETIEFEELEEIEEIENVEESLEDSVTETAFYQETIAQESNYIYEELLSFETLDDGKVESVEENYGDTIQKYSEISGIDSSLLTCIFAQERGTHSDEIDPLGTIGIAQIQYNQHVGYVRSIENVLTNEKENFQVTDELVKSLDGNIKTGTAILQNMIKEYNGNTLIALQAYNYGAGAMNQVLRNAEARTGISVEEMIHNPTCLVWLEDAKNYMDGTYGDPNYITNVLRRYKKETFTAIYQENPVIYERNQNEKSLVL